MPILKFEGKKPQIHQTCYVAPNATVIGDVTIGRESSVWPGAVIRGDFNKIVIGARTSVQDNCVIHIGTESPTTIGDEVTVGHAANVEGCIVGNHVILGMGAVVLEGTIIEDWVIVAAGALLKEHSHAYSKTLVGGIPAKFLKNLGPEHLDRIRRGAELYVDMSRTYREMKIRRKGES